MRRTDPNAQNTIALDAERAVVNRLKQGDIAALGELFDWYGDRLYRQAVLPRLPVHELAEDVVAETFRVAMERIEQFSSERSVYFWLHRIAVNRAIDVHRRQARKTKIEGSIKSEQQALQGGGVPADAANERKENRALIEETFVLLKPRYAQALRLRLLEDHDRQDCAEVMEISVGNFDVLLHRATRAFRDKYPPR